jgi:hypothetical protein
VSLSQLISRKPHKSTAVATSSLKSVPKGLARIHAQELIEITREEAGQPQESEKSDNRRAEPRETECRLSLFRCVPILTDSSAEPRGNCETRSINTCLSLVSFRRRRWRPVRKGVNESSALELMVLTHLGALAGGGAAVSE